MMTFIRFMKEKARQIVFDQDPGFRVVAYQQIELERGVYRCRTIIQELSTGKFFSACFRTCAEDSDKKKLKPFDHDEPVFQEVTLKKNHSL